MKAADADVAAILVKALRRFQRLENAMKLDKPEDGYTRLVVAVSVESDSEDGSETHSEVQVDMVTGRLLAPILQKLIQDRLTEIGVEL